MQEVRQPGWFDQVLERLPEGVSFALVIVGCLLLAQVIWAYFPAEPNTGVSAQVENTTVASRLEAGGKPLQR